MDNTSAENKTTASRRTRGTGSMMERSPGVWRLKCYCGRDESGKKIYSYRQFVGSRTKAERELRRFQNEIEERHGNGIVERSKVTTFGQALDSWIESHAKKRASTTRDRYVQIVRDYVRPGLGDYNLKSIKLEHVQSFYDTIGNSGTLSNQSVKHIHSVTRNVANFAVKMGWLSSNPTKGAVVAEPANTEMLILSEDQVGILLAYCLSHQDTSGFNTNWIVPILIAAWTGMRRSEVLGITFDSVDTERRIIEVRQSVVITDNGFEFKEPKTKSSRRSLYVSKTLIDVIVAHKERVEKDKQRHINCYKDRNLVCCRPNGLPIYPDNLTNAFKKVLQRAGLPRIRFHDLRHTHASILLKTQPVHTVSRRLGHASARITLDVYGHLLPGMSEEVVDVFDEAIGQGTDASSET